MSDSEAPVGAVIRHAATLVIFDERDDAAPHLLMVERSRELAFAGGAMVFPGGAVDPADLDMGAALAPALDPAEAGARICAIRETIEECGVGIGFREQPDRFTLAHIRQHLQSGGALHSVLAETGLELELDRLVPFARWCPPPRLEQKRRFDTRFYLARLPGGSHYARVDATENVDLLWTSAQHMLDRCDRGEGKIIFPTRRNLERLAQFRSFDEAVAHAQAIPVETVAPWQEERDGGRYLCIPDHLGYPVTSELMTSVQRG